MDDGMCSTYVSAGHVLFFASGVSEQRKEDVINSSLYMQLSASDKYQKYDNVEEWSGKCKKLMTLFGWLSLREDSQQYSDDSQTSFQLDQRLLALLGSTLPATLVARFQRFLADLRSPSSSHVGLALLHEYAVDSRPDRNQASLALQISFVGPGSVMTTVFLSSKMLQPISPPAMAAHFAADRKIGSLDITVVSMEIIERQYRRVRGRIVAEVGSAKNDLLIALDGGTVHE
ncbi:hypothetical protein ACTUVN_002003 [Pseudomonas caspiana]